MFRRFNSTLSSFSLFQPEMNGPPLINGISASGFTVNNMKTKGPIFVHQKVFLWHVPQYGLPFGNVTNGSVFDGWDKKMFGLFDVVEPLPELLIIGSGAENHQLPLDLSKYLHECGIQVEVMSTVFVKNSLIEKCCCNI
jgi:NADH dehydrogenase [ubiquinone] 1 alpha subcomplex assembly factor 3